MPISHTPQMRSIQLSHKSRTNGSATFQTVQTVGRPLLPGRPMTLCQVDEHTSRDYATSHSWCATHSLSKRPSFSPWWHFWRPGNGAHPLDHFSCFLGFTPDSSIYFSAQQKTSENSDILKKTIKFSIYEMGIRYFITVALYSCHKYITGIL